MPVSDGWYTRVHSAVKIHPKYKIDERVQLYALRQDDKGDREDIKMNIYVGNLPREVNEEELRGTFEPFGQVTSAKIITDKFSGVSRGFGFVEMADDEEAKAALAGLNGKELKGRTLTVNEARPRGKGARAGAGQGV